MSGNSGDTTSPWLGWFILIVAFWAILVPAASAASSTKTFSIPAGEAADSLTQFAAQADRQLMYSGTAVEGVRTSPVNGEFTPRAAIERLLQWTPLAAVEDPRSGAFSITHEDNNAPVSTSTRQPQTMTSPVPKPKDTKQRKNPVAFLGALFGLVFGTVAEAPAQTQPATSLEQTGTLAGRVTDQSTGTPLQGAAVEIVGTSFKTYTDSGGRYRISQVPISTYEVSVSYLGHDPMSSPATVTLGEVSETDFLLDSGVYQMEAFQVTSILEGQARAINRQRAAETITTIVASDAAGNLPDLNVEDVLSRLAGVAITADGGVTIRGAAPEFNSVTLDGERMSFAADDGSRAVSLDNVDADLISSIEVIRALLPNMDADGIGGTVNLVTRSALDLQRRTISGRVDYSENGIGGPAHAFAFTFGDIIGEGKWGYMLNLSYRHDEAGRETGEIDYDHTRFEGFSLMNQIDNRVEMSVKDRYGVNGTIDYKLSDTTRLYFKGFFNRDESERTQYRLRVDLRNAIAGTASADSAEGTETLIQRPVDERVTTRNYYRVAAGGRSEADRYRLDYEVNYDRSAADQDRTRVDAPTPSRNPHDSSRRDRQTTWSYDRTNRLWPVVTLENPYVPGVDPLNIYDAQTIDRMTFSGTPPKSNYEEGYNGRVDLTLMRDIADRPVEFRFGTKYRGKFKKSAPVHERWDFSNQSGFDVLTLADFLEGGYEPTDVAHGRIPTLGKFPSVDVVREEYLSIIDSQTPEESIYPTGSGRLRERVEGAYFDALRRTYTASESIMSAYGMGTVDFGKLRLIGGLRVEQTNNSYKAKRFNEAMTIIEPIDNKSDYHNLFPSVTGIYRLNDNHVLRAAWTNTIARPRYTHLVPHEIIPDDGDDFDEDFVIDMGNPNLEAQTSRNFDLAYEWYFQPVGLLTVAAFTKDIEKFIYESLRFERVVVNLAPEGEPEDFREVERRIRTNRNGADAKLRGMEISWQQQLAFLPSPFDGLGFNVNYAYVEGESRIPDDITGGLITYDYLFNQAKDVYNAQLFYEKYRFSARVAMRYNGGWNQEVSDTGNVVVNPTTYWDASVQYNLTSGMTLFVESRNFTKEIESWYFGTPDTPTEYQIENYGYRAGVRFRF